MSLKTPILLIIWKRPELTRKVINAVKAVNPAKLYVACDGARENRLDEFDLVLKTKDVVEQTVDWPCEVHYRYSDYNQGCAYGVSNAISWFFEHEEEGIILEDDCVPHSLFFDYCGVMLERYRNNPKVMHIGGVSYHSISKISLGDYYYSRYGHIWGWATWRRAWRLFELQIVDDTDQINDTIKIFSTTRQKKYWFQIFTQQRDTPIDTWDYSWQYTILKNKGYCIYPSYTMVDNIGFGIDATHTPSAPKIMPKSNYNPKFNQAFRANPIQLRLINNYYDYINFLRAFKGKDINFARFSSFLKYLKENNYD